MKHPPLELFLPGQAKPLYKNLHCRHCIFLGTYDRGDGAVDLVKCSTEFYVISLSRGYLPSKTEEIEAAQRWKEYFALFEENNV